jgi:hypothetical protein
MRGSNGQQFFATEICCTLDLRGIFRIFDGTCLALSARSDESGCNNQTTLQARTPTPEGWSSI